MIPVTCRSTLTHRRMLRNRWFIFFLSANRIIPLPTIEEDHKMGKLETKCLNISRQYFQRWVISERRISSNFPLQWYRTPPGRLMFPKFFGRGEVCIKGSRAGKDSWAERGVKWFKIYLGVRSRTSFNLRYLFRERWGQVGSPHHEYSIKRLWCKPQSGLIILGMLDDGVCPRSSSGNF